MIDINKLFNDMGSFSVEMFPDADSANHILKMKHEADEIINDPTDISEYADCLLCLYAAAYKAGFNQEKLAKASTDKLSILKSRKWKKMEDGTYQHIKENNTK